MKYKSQKRIVITGGAQGLGRATALRFARDGWKVLIADVLEDAGLSTADDINSAGGQAIFQPCDVRSEASFESLLATCQQQWGGVDVLVNNAGVASSGSIEKEPMDNWRRVMDINTLGAVRGCKVFTPAMKAQGGGHIVNIASIAGINCTPYMASYNVSKAAVIALSETLRWELKKSYIGVTAVCPALFPTALTDSVVGGNPKVIAVINQGMNQSELSAEDIADSIYRAVKRNQFMLLPHKSTRWQWRLKRLSADLYQWFFSRMA